MRGKIISLFIFVALLAPALAGASGLAVTPSKLVIDPSIDKENIITVENISTETLSFEVYPDEMKKAFSIKPRALS